MKTKLLSLLLAVATSVGTMFADGTKIGDLYYSLDATNQTAQVTYQLQWDYNNYQGLTTANIPASVTYNSVTYSVTSIGNYAFRLCGGLTSVTIPNSVTSIGGGAFEDCTGLTSVTIPNSVTSIGDYAFYGCSMTSVTIPNSVTSIGEFAFATCSGLTSVTIPNSVTSIDGGAFIHCSSLTSVTLNSNAIVSQESSFNSNIKNIFGSQVKEYIIGEGVTSIGDGAFSGCSSLTSVTIGNSVTSIGSSAFYGCSSLTSIEISNSVTSIGEGAFYGCSGLTSVTIPNSVTSIGDMAFQGCSGLTSVTIPNSVTSIGDHAFSYCSSLPVVDNLRYADTYLVEAVDRTLSSYTIKKGTKWIGGFAFANCSNLTSVTIPNSVTSIGRLAFSDCTSLASVTIPNSVTSIGSSAFSNCTSLTSVTIPNSVTSIGDWAFSYCSSLVSATIGNGIKSIGKQTFYNCTNLETISLGNSLETIESEAFKGCEQIIDIYSYAERVPTVQTSTFDGVSRKAYVWVPANRLSNYKTHEIWGEFDVQTIEVDDVNTSIVTIVPSDNSAKIIWPVVEDADTYEITITDQNGNIVCKLVFDSNGLLQSIAFGAPSRDNTNEAVQATGFRCEVTGLNAGTKYNYTIASKDATETVLDTKEGSFTTTGGIVIAVDNASVESKLTKVLLNGQLLILRDGKTYTLQGVEVK